MGKPMDLSNLLFAKPGTFAQAFPTLEKAEIKYTENNIHGKVRSGYSDEGLMACGNPRCHRGGYRFKQEIQSMLNSGKTENTFRMHCPGDEGTPGGRKKCDPCDYSV